METELKLGNPDILSDIFGLPTEWAKGLYSIEYCLTKQAIHNEDNVEIRLIKEKWLQDWEKYTSKYFQTYSDDKEFSLICDDVALQEYLKQLSKTLKHNSYMYLVIVESIFFQPFFDMDPNTIDQSGEELKNCRYKLDKTYLSIFVRSMGIDEEVIVRFIKAFKRANMVLSDKGKTIAISAVLSGILIAITMGHFAPLVAVWFAQAGLSGAAAISSGLATLGGGSIAMGGTGMAGGIAVLVSTGGILGVLGGTGVGALAASSPEFATYIASKLEAYFKVFVLEIVGDTTLARSILKGQETYIQQLLDSYEENSKLLDGDDKKTTALKKTIKILQRSLQRNIKALLESLDPD